ncbi:oxidoreductase [Amycolatopsis rhabdoformis]|uniref:Oxidoreductase n=1 Tax=Amycolatopsis rhabdoformis TaxID=1448059 RepID=A0ABZ1IKC6_9PSEU|nr:oxidoreductase [Amycolatopsis rhabdoformis]WSE34921.1 oxidoreductase [Amycolatopsis rhabdoformis]
MTNETPGHVWLISGCSSGFGRELVRAALAAGDRVMATARRPETLADLTHAGGDRISTAAMDVTDPASIHAAVEATLEAFGRIDVLVNNAGTSVIGAVEETPAADLRAMFDVNYFGAVELTQAVLPVLRAQGSGTIVVMSSLGGVMTFPGLSGYNATKHALEALGEALSIELAPLGIRVVVVEPGMFRTQFSTSLQWTPENPAYAATSGELRRMVKGVVGLEANDPAKGAAAIVEVLGSENPPLHFLLGEDAVEGLRNHHEGVLAEAREWESLSRSTTAV